MEHTRFSSPSAIGHAYILSSPSREDSLRRAREIASAAVCLREHDVPCGVCRGCRKAAADIHPDIISIRRETDRNGNPKRELTVSMVRELAVNAQVLPNEADRKAFIIEEAELMNLNAQNAILKLLEEPPPTVIFLLCVCNPGLLLETVRSRCAMIGIGGQAQAQDEEVQKLADGFLTAVRSGDRRRLFRWIAKNELSRLDETTAFIDAALERTVEILCGRLSPGTLSPEQQMHLYRLLQQCSEHLKVNVNAKHIFSLLATEALPFDEAVPMLSASGHQIGETL